MPTGEKARMMESRNYYQAGKYRIILSVYILPTYSRGTSLFARMSEQQWFEHLHHKHHKEGKTQISL